MGATSRAVAVAAAVAACLLTASLCVAGQTTDNGRSSGGSRPSDRVSLRSLAQRVRSKRIAGGVEAQRYRYPYMAALRDEEDVFCGAVLIYSRWALTAAHCVYPYEAVGKMFLSLGSHSRYYDPGEESVEEIDIQNIHVHPGYFASIGEEDDIAVIELASDSSYTPISLPDSWTTVDVGQLVLALGWGLESPVLEEAYMYLVDLGQCSASWGYLGSAFICAKADGVDTCPGDSGGPLIIPDRAGSAAGDILIGITSFGEDECEISYSPGGYARVESYLDWISDVVSYGIAPNIPIPEGR